MLGLGPWKYPEPAWLVVMKSRSLFKPRGRLRILNRFADWPLRTTFLRLTHSPKRFSRWT